MQSSMFKLIIEAVIGHIQNNNGVKDLDINESTLE